MNTRLNYSFPSSVRLRTRQQYKRMTHHSIKYKGQWIIVEILPTSHPSSRLGITVTKRFGCACQRNRFKRMVREAFRLTYRHFAVPLDILVKPRSQALHAHMQSIQQELISFVDQNVHKLNQQAN